MIDDTIQQVPEVTQEVAQQEPQQAEVAQKPVETPAESQKEVNMRLLRERAEHAERRAMELERMIAQKQQAPVSEPQEEELDISDDTYIEGKHLKKYVKSLKQELKNTKKEFEEFSQRSSLANAEIRLKSQFVDFDNVVNLQNLEKLSQQKPALYRSIMANQDIYDRGYTAYEMIKNTGIIEETYPSQDKKLEENRSKPRSVATVSPQQGETPLSHVGEYDRRVLTEERKDQLRRQVQEAKRNRV